jgi:hypothetical protein
VLNQFSTTPLRHWLVGVSGPPGKDPPVPLVKEARCTLETRLEGSDLPLLSSSFTRALVYILGLELVDIIQWCSPRVCDVALW